MNALTKPEWSCSRGQSRRIADIVREDGGCAYCKNRSGLFETLGRRALCGLTPAKAFPACIENTKHGFNFDEPAFQAMTNTDGDQWPGT